MTDQAFPQSAMTKVFFECPAIGGSVLGTEPTALDTASAIALALNFISAAVEGDFFGFIDGKGHTLQMYLEPSGSVWMEVPTPEVRGTYGASLGLDEAKSLISALPSAFGNSTVPGATLQQW